HHARSQHAIDRVPLLLTDDRLRRRDHREFGVHAAGPSCSSSESSAGRGASARGEEARSSPPVESSGMYHSPVVGHTQASVPSEVGTTFSPDRPTQPRRRAGTPATRAWGGTSLTTVAPAATIAQAPIVTGATHTA